MAARGAPSMPEGPLPPSEADYDSDYYSPSDDIQELLERYTVTCKPEYFVKLRKNVDKVTLGSNYCFGKRGRYWTFSLKPADRQRHAFLYKLATSPADSAVRLTTNKMPLIPGSDLLRVQVNFEYNWATRSREIFWRVTSKWSTGTAISRKEKYRLNDRVQLWPHWHMALHVPEVEGRFGGQDPDVTVDKGYCHISVPKVVLRTCLDGLRDCRPFRRRQPCQATEGRHSVSKLLQDALPNVDRWAVVPPATNAIQVAAKGAQQSEPSSDKRRRGPRMLLPWHWRRR